MPLLGWINVGLVRIPSLRSRLVSGPITVDYTPASYSCVLRELPFKNVNIISLLNQHRTQNEALPRCTILLGLISVSHPSIAFCVFRRAQRSPTR